MISLLNGTVSGKEKDLVVVMTPGGVGYDVRMTRSHVVDLGVGEKVTLFTHLKVSDTAMQLYGFRSVEERSFFSLLLSVSGVGPKSALNVLSIGSITEIQAAIGRGDVKYLTAVQGMGKKTAERVVVELKTKVRVEESEKRNQNAPDGAVLSEVIDGLVALGYQKSEAQGVVQGLEGAGKTAEELLRVALRAMAK